MGGWVGGGVSDKVGGWVEEESVSDWLYVGKCVVALKYRAEGKEEEGWASGGKGRHTGMLPCPSFHSS